MKNQIIDIAIYMNIYTFFQLERRAFDD